LPIFVSLIVYALVLLIAGVIPREFRSWQLRS